MRDATGVFVLVALAVAVGGSVSVEAGTGDGALLAVGDGERLAVSAWVVVGTAVRGGASVAFGSAEKVGEDDRATGVSLGVGAEVRALAGQGRSLHV